MAVALPLSQGRLNSQKKMNDTNINCITNDTGQVCTIPASDPIITPFFSSGEVMICFLLLIIIVLFLISFLRKSIKSIPVTTMYMGNNSQNGKKIYKI